MPAAAGAAGAARRRARRRLTRAPLAPARPADPADKKPDDWVEDAEIVDESVEKPEGYGEAALGQRLGGG